MEDCKHLLSETAVWKTSSEFVDAKGQVSEGIGETHIEIRDEAITNSSWVMLNRQKINNKYVIRKISEKRYEYESENPHLGTQSGFFDIDKHFIFSKFSVDNKNLNGYEIISREGDICFATGALYDGDELVNSWTCRMMKD